MNKTVATRAGVGQRAHDGLHAFSGVQGADSISTRRRRPERQRRNACTPTPAETERAVLQAGERFLVTVFGDEWRDDWDPSTRLDAVWRTPLDPRWVERRIEKLRPMSDGPARLLPKSIWNLAAVLMHQGSDWLRDWKHCARSCPREWLLQFTGVAAITANGDMHKLNLRMQRMLVAGLLAWQLAEYAPSDDGRGYDWVVRGLPYGAWQHMLACWEQYPGGAELRVPSRSAVFGTHVPGGRFERAEVGYVAAWKQAGIARSTQPNGWFAPPGMRGPVRKNKRGDDECWGFHELRLRVGAPLGAEILPMGPPQTLPMWKRCPPPPPLATGELEAVVNELERSWYADEEPLAAPLPTAAEPVVPYWLLQPEAFENHTEPDRSALEAVGADAVLFDVRSSLLPDIDPDAEPNSHFFDVWSAYQRAKARTKRAAPRRTARKPPS